MLRHAIAPSRRYTKASHDVVRHARLTSDAKILLLAVQGLPDGLADRPLSEHARKLGIKGRAYQKSKALLTAHGYVHEWREQGAHGRWATEQLFSSVPLTPEEAVALRQGLSPKLPRVPVQASPGMREPTAGEPTARVAGRQLPVEEEREKTIPHPPSEAEPEAEPDIEPEPEPESVPGTEAGPIPELAEGERVLLSLRHVRRELYLGVKEARSLADLAARWLLRGVTADELRRVLTSELPGDGVRSAVGFLRFRMLQKMPPELPSVAPPQPAGPLPAPALMTCTGPGEEHAFRPLADETECGPCRRRAAWAYWTERRAAGAEEEAGPGGPVPWRERFAKLGTVTTEGEPGRSAT